MGATIRIAILANAAKAKAEMTSLSDVTRKSFSKIGTFAKVGLTAVGVGAGALLKSAVTAASDLNETTSKAHAIFGKNAAEIDQWASSAATSLGMSKQAALDAASGFGDMFLQLGISGAAATKLSKQTVQLATDFGSFNNLPTADVADAIAGAYRGEYDSLQRLVPNISAARVEQVALTETHKKSAKQLTASDKALAVNAILTKDGARAMGDFARTSSGAANQQRILSAKLDDVKAKLGAVILPIWTSIVTKASDLVTWVEKVAKTKGAQEFFTTMKTILQDARDRAGEIYTKIKDIFGLKDMGSIDSMSSSLHNVAEVLGNKDFKAFFGGLGESTLLMWGLAAATGAVSSGFIAMNTAIRNNPLLVLAAEIGIIWGLVKKDGGIGNFLARTFDMRPALRNIHLAPVADFLTATGNMFQSWFTTNGAGNQMLLTKVKAAWSATQGFFKSWFTTNGDGNQMLLTKVKAGWNGLTGFFQSWFTTNGAGNQMLLNKVKSWWSATPGWIKAAWKGLGDFLGRALDPRPAFKKVFGGAATWLMQPGSQTVQGFINGISSMFAPLAAKMREVANMPKDIVMRVLNMHSPSLVMTALGFNTTIGYANGISAGAPAVSAAVREVIAGAKDQFGSLQKGLDGLLTGGTNTTPAFIQQAQDLNGQIADAAGGAAEKVATANEKVIASRQAVTDAQTAYRAAATAAAAADRTAAAKTLTAQKALSAAHGKGAKATLKAGAALAAARLKQAATSKAGDAKELAALKALNGKRAELADANNVTTTTSQQYAVLLDKAKVAQLQQFITDSGTKLQALADQRDTVAQQLETAQGRLTDAVKIRDDFSSAVRDASAKLGDLLSLKTGTGGWTSVTLIRQQLAQRLTMVQDFAAGITSLVSRGLSQDLASQLATAGAESAGATVQALLKGSAGDIGAINDLQSQIVGASAGLGSQLADTYYGAGVQQAQALVAGLQAQQAAIDAQMSVLTASVQQSYDEMLGIATKANAAQVANTQAAYDDLTAKTAALGASLKAAMTANGAATGAGLVVGIKSQQASVIAAMTALATAANAAYARTLKIHSPSQVMADLGRSTVEGVAVGIRAGTAGVVAAMGGVASTVAGVDLTAARVTMPTVGGAGAGGPAVTINGLTVTIPGSFDLSSAAQRKAAAEAMVREIQEALVAYEGSRR